MTRRLRSGHDDRVVEPLASSDLVALAQCHALDATTFPHPSLPVLFAGAPPAIWVARLIPRSSETGAVVGFVASRAAPTPSRPAREIMSLAVDVGHRGVGLGRALLQATVADARERGLAAVTLHVSSGNGAALELYTSEGFRASRRLVRFYNPARFPDGGDAYEMVLRLR